ncbi:MAG: hypothetical protein Q7T55_09980 [Solirubrobacteraceae bacterium]|nr:hypothetical protein [Solirubrobacteraceae bacterium]
MTRRIVAGLGALLILFAVALLLNSCVNSSRVNGLKDYSEAVTRLGEESTQNVNQALAVLTNADNADALEQRQRLNDLAADGARFTDRARDLSTPGGLEATTQNLATALSLRSTAVARIADLIGKARGTSATEQELATTRIAGQMTALLASDVLWQARVTPFIKQKFQDYDRSSDGVTASISLGDATWTNTSTVANRIGGVAPEDAPADSSKELAPGTHGHGLFGVSINKTPLSDTGVTRVSNPSGTSIVVTIENQGENDEENVTVAVTGTAQNGGATIFNQTQKVALSATGTKTPVPINITKEVSDSVRITAEVKKVDGEDNTTNNKKTYSVIFAK